MNYQYDYISSSNELESLQEDFAVLFLICLIISVLFILLLLRNWYNLYKKRSFRKKYNLLKTQLLKLQPIEQQLANKTTEVFELEKQLKDYKEKFYNTLSEKDKEITLKKEELNHQKNAYENYLRFKNIELNSTRLGAHFLKNIISQIYEDLEYTDISYSSFLGFHYRFGRVSSKLPPLKALKHIFSLLDYNVNALNKKDIQLKEELEYIDMFLELIKYLKPYTSIEFKNQLTKKRTKDIVIKPTLLFPFIENALKHGSLNNNDSFISIILKEDENNILSYSLVNSIEEREDYKTTSKNSFGLTALKQLLDAYYPNSELLNKPLPNNQYLSELTINLS
ncbi:hypothetical protein [Mesoflavibacter sp. CH_XMU1422-2]|uniref:hypothetical protein n=1 Tax=Mesoflavibacter sp. CH_XMU1422-2 TaxID=3107770 RepID=UPI00300948ED